MSEPQESQELQAWHSIFRDCVAVIASLPSEYTSTTAFEEEQTIPQLASPCDIPDIRSELRDYYLSPDQVENCALIFEKSVSALAMELQAIFENAWRQLPLIEDVRTKGQKALVELHNTRYRAAVARSKRDTLEAAGAYRNARMLAHKGEDIAAEWTEETRALMERVYQQHPKLEAHEKKLLAEASGLSLRQISIWFANQRQRKGWPVVKQEQQEQSNSIVEEPEEDEENDVPATPAKSFLSASQSSSTSSSSCIERSPTPLTPFSASSACPSLSSSTSSRSSSDSYAPSPTRAYFHPHPHMVNSQAPTLFDFTLPQQQQQSTASSAAAPVLDIDQLIRQLTPPLQPAAHAITSEVPSTSTFSPCIPTFIPTPPNEKIANGPFAMKNEDADMSGGSSGKSTPPIPQDTFQWLPINMQGLLPQSDTTLSQSQSVDDFTPQAAQFTFAPLQLDTSQYLQQSPSHDVDLSSVVNSFDADGFWNNFMTANSLPQMPAGLASMQQQADSAVTIAQPEANWSDVFLKDMETWGKQPQQAQLQLQF